MTHRKSWTASLVTLLLLTANSSQAADPEFKVGLVTESREYDREKQSVAIGGIRVPAGTEWTSRVTVALDGVRITGEWVPETSISASAEDFPRGSDVEAAATRNQLLLKHPDGSIVRTKIVRRVKPEAEADEHD